MPHSSSSDVSRLSALLEAFLFSEGGPVSLRKLGEFSGATSPQLDEALKELSASLSGRGIVLVRTETEASLAVAATQSEAIKKASEEALEREIGEAGLEVLAIILYCGPSTRARIDYIRGVNTSSTIRTLLSRGLVERIANPEDGREYLYRPTVELLAHLGVRGTAELPEYATILAELRAFEVASSRDDHHASDRDNPTRHA